MKQKNHFDTKQLSFDDWEKINFSKKDLEWLQCSECGGTGYTICDKCDSEIDCNECNTDGSRLVDKKTQWSPKQIYDYQFQIDKKLVDKFLHGNY